MISLQRILLFIVCSIFLLSCQKPTQKREIKHVDVYYEPGRFGGWPANHGIWIWDNEILVGFGKGYYKNLGTERHNIDRERPEEHLFARSFDGGETWNIEEPAKDGIMIARGKSLHGVEPDPDKMRSITKLQKPMDFSHPGFVLKFWMLSVSSGPSIFYYSYDKGKSWDGPFSLKVDEMTKIAARVDYMIEDNNSCMAFLTAAKSDDSEGRVFTARTDDGGLSWQFVSWVGKELDNGFSIMPSTVRNSENELVLTSRVRIESDGESELESKQNQETRYIDSWLSTNNGTSWDYLGKPVDDLGEGNPPSLIKLKDGRLCLTYGYRAEPFGIFAKISEDNGRTWGKQITIRDDGSGRDVGYVRSIQRPDGKVVVVYYFMDKQKPERYIAASIWNPKQY
jgi:hypothetical protein